MVTPTKNERARLIELFVNVERYRAKHESWFDTVERLMLEALCDEGMSQREMSALLGVHWATLNRRLQNLSLRPMDLAKKQRSRSQLKVVGGSDGRV